MRMAKDISTGNSTAKTNETKEYLKTNPALIMLLVAPNNTKNETVLYGYEKNKTPYVAV